MASKFTVTLTDDQLRDIQHVTNSRRKERVSVFIQQAIKRQVENAVAYRRMLQEALEQTGGPLTDEERGWADAIAAGQRRKYPTRKRKAA